MECNCDVCTGKLNFADEVELCEQCFKPLDDCNCLDCAYCGCIPNDCECVYCYECDQILEECECYANDDENEVDN